MATYRKETVTVVGDVKQGDPGFKPGAALIKIKHEDGREEAVPKAEVTDA